jgi:hypothetical protein
MFSKSFIISLTSKSRNKKEACEKLLLNGFIAFNFFETQIEIIMQQNRENGTTANIAAVRFR